MLDIALEFLRDELKSYIIARTGPTLTEVKLTPVVDDCGKYVIPEDGIGLSLINVEEERTVKEHLPQYSYLNGQQIRLEPELRLNLHLLIAPNFRQYDQGLKYLAHVITFFQAHSVFTSARYPALNSGIEKLVVELISLSYDQLSQVWTYIGGKQLPSVIYKVRMVTVQDLDPEAIQPPITNIGATIGGMS